MLIILHTPSFALEPVPVDGALRARHTVSLTCEAGVITLDRNDCRRILPAVAYLAEHGVPLESEDDEQPV